MRNLVIFSGAGMSAESGLNTFRDNGGLWENHRVEDVATPAAWRKDPEQVLRFYNQRRKQLREAAPNKAHLAIADLEKNYDVTVITQNVDDLHEQAGSTDVLHLHGELKKAQSSLDPKLVYPIKGDELNIGDKCEKGSQLRPNVVWFGEAVPKMEKAYSIVSAADVFVVVGTSLNVYPAAGLIHAVPVGAKKYIIDPQAATIAEELGFTIMKATAVEGIKILIDNYL